VGAAPNEVVVEDQPVKGITLRPVKGITLGGPFVVLQPASVLGRLRRSALGVVSVLLT
jgi:hypothetical protein